MSSTPGKQLPPWHPGCDASAVEEHEAELPSDEAYGRVTNPERYAVLQVAARRAVDDLAAAYDTVRTDGVDLVPCAARSWPGARSTLLVPAGGGAPIAVVLTPFPGVAVHAGRAFAMTFPACGCDACDERPEDLVERLRSVLAEVVAGGLVEIRRRRVLRSDRCTIRLERADGTSSTQTECAFDPVAHGELPVGTTRWPAWHRRD